MVTKRAAQPPKPAMMVSAAAEGVSVESDGDDQKPARSTKAMKATKETKDKRKKYTLTIMESEHDVLMALRQVHADISGAKIKKSHLYRVALNLLFSAPQKKVQGALAKLQLEESNK